MNRGTVFDVAKPVWDKEKERLDKMKNIREQPNVGEIVKLKPEMFEKFGYYEIMKKEMLVSNCYTSPDGRLAVEVLCEDNKYRNIDSVFHLEGNWKF